MSQIRQLGILGLVLALLIWLPGAATANDPIQDTAKIERADYARVVADPENDVAFRQMLNKLPKITVGGRFYYVLEGDLLLTEGQVRDTFRRYSTEPRPASPTGELKVMTQNGKPVFWPPGHRRLTYAIDPVSFTSGEREIISTNLKAASRSWVSACPACGVSFTELAAFGPEPTFRVVKAADLSDLVALSFFPNDPADMRLLRIAPSYFQLGIGSFNPIGILRHELGHVLGYRHEHIADIPGCAYEDDHWRAVTAYDNKSVMHYFCGGGGSMTLDLTVADKTGHKVLYGAHP